MPFWITHPGTGEQVYVDENGNPVDPNGPITSLDSPSPTSDAGASQPASPPSFNSPSTPPALPSAVAPPTLPGIKPGQGQSYSQGVSGFSEQRSQSIGASKATSRLDQERQNALGRAEQTGAIEGAGAAAAAQGQIDSALGMSDVQSQQEATRSDMYREQAKMHSMFAAAEVAASDLARERTVAARGRFEQAAAAAAAMQVNPGLQLSRSQGLGLGIALFAQGFLQAQGTPVANISGMVGQMVDRNVELQLEKIRRGEKLAQNQQQLWDMARAEASDEADARLRVRGLYLAQAAAGMEAEMSKYNSKLAMARGLTAAADIRAEFQKTAAEITDRTFKRYMGEYGMELDRWKTQQQLSREDQRIALAKKELALKAGQDKNNPLGDVIFDTSKSGQGMAKWMFLPGTKDSDKTEIRLQVGEQSAFLDLLDQYEELSKEAGEVYQGWGRAMANPAFRSRIEGLRTGLATTYAKAAFGGRFTDEDMRKAESRIPINSLTQRDGENKVRLAMSDMTREVIAAVDRKVGSVATAIPEGMREQFPRAGTNQFARGENARANVRGQTNITPENDFYARRAIEARSPATGLSDTKLSGKRGSEEWVDFLRTYQAAGALNKVAPDLVDSRGVPKHQEDQAKILKGLQPEYARSLDFIARDIQSQEAERSQRATEVLKALAEDPTFGYKRNYAQWLLERNGIDYNDPNAGPEDVKGTLDE